jgi:hypothetical protein
MATHAERSGEPGVHRRQRTDRTADSCTASPVDDPAHGRTWPTDTARAWSLLARGVGVPTAPTLRQGFQIQQAGQAHAGPAIHGKHGDVWSLALETAAYAALSFLSRTMTDMMPGASSIRRGPDHFPLESLSAQSAPRPTRATSSHHQVDSGNCRGASGPRRAERACGPGHLALGKFFGLLQTPGTAAEHCPVVTCESPPASPDGGRRRTGQRVGNPRQQREF